MPTIYVTPVDMRDFYEEIDLIQATNLNDPRAEHVDESKLAKACEYANGVIDGYLMVCKSTPDPDACRAHGGAIARNFLDGSTEEIRAKADDAYEWLKMISSFCAKNGGVIPGGDNPNDLLGVGTIAFSPPPGYYGGLGSREWF